MKIQHYRPFFTGLFCWALVAVVIAAALLQGPSRRPALHSWKLSLRHPITGQELNFTAPVPEDMAGLLKARNES